MSLISFVISHYDCSVRCSCLKFFSFQVIAVPWPNNTDIQQLSPSHVVVRRCSGGCHGSRSCVAGATKVRSVSVMLARCPVGGGKCEKQCASLEVEDEVECQCGCPKHLEQECLAKVETHSWSRETCGCECRDEKERRSCLESGGKVWDSSSCSCLCPLSLQTCSSGLRLDLSSCSCLPDHLAGQIETRGAAREDRESQDTSSLTTYLLSRWIEVLVIGLLAFTAVLLAILCGVFLRRIHQLKTQLAAGSEGCVVESVTGWCEDSQLFLPSTSPQPGPGVDCLDVPEFHPSKLEREMDSSQASQTSPPSPSLSFPELISDQARLRQSLL